MSTPFRIVIIDDDADLRELIKVTLEFTAGWEVVTAADGPEGIAAVRRSTPDAVVVDLMMPGMDGYEVCRQLRQDPETAEIHLVLLTARRQLDQAQFESAGSVGVIFKPFELDDLAPRILELCGSRDG